MSNLVSEFRADELHEECGVFGIYDLDGGDIASSIYYGLFALQHRGQESCGIAVSDTRGPKGRVQSVKGMGLVNEVFHHENLSGLKGDIGVGHVRYSTAGASCNENTQPPKSEGLTEDETRERDILRQEYLAAFRKNLTAQLDNTYIVDEKGNKRKLTRKK